MISDDIVYSEEDIEEQKKAIYEFVIYARNLIFLFYSKILLSSTIEI